MKKESLLIIEDDPVLAEMYQQAFTAAEIEVLVARDGGEGVTLAFAHHPTVILVDINLPVLSGHEVVSRIRNDAEAWGRSAKIIYLTNASDPENVVNAVSQGSEEYIVKANTTVPEVVNIVRTAMHT